MFADDAASVEVQRRSLRSRSSNGVVSSKLRVAVCMVCCCGRVASWVPPAPLVQGGALKPSFPLLQRAASGAGKHTLSLRSRRRPQSPRMVMEAGAAAATSSPPQTSTAKAGSEEPSPPPPPTHLSLEAALEAGVNRALRGDGAVLRQVLAHDATWSGPIGSFRGVAAIETELRSLGQFFQEPRFTILPPDKEKAGESGGGDGSVDGSTELQWIASATWPLPWLPRLIVRGNSAVKTAAAPSSGAAAPAPATGAVSVVWSISDAWTAPLQALALWQLVPGFWDLWHQLCSRLVEQYPHAVVAKRKGYEVRRCPPRLCVEASLVDRSNSRRKRLACLLPDFVFSADLRTSGRSPELYSATGPVEVSVAPLLEEATALAGGPYLNGTTRTKEVRRRANRITWLMQAPTAFGLDPAALGPCDGGVDAAEGDVVRVVQQWWRTMAVAPFNGRPQDPEAADVRRALLERLAADGETPARGEDGRPLWAILQHDGKVGWNRQGQICIGIWEHRPKWIGNGNELCIYLATPEEAADASSATA